MLARLFFLVPDRSLEVGLAVGSSRVGQQSSGKDSSPLCSLSHGAGRAEPHLFPELSLPRIQGFRFAEMEQKWNRSDAAELSEQQIPTRVLL